jgi:hypothetical protein
MKTLTLIFAVALCGCSTSYVTKSNTDGTKFSGFNSRFIWASEGIEMTYNTNGATVKIQKSNPDAVTAAAITDAAVSAAIKGAKP